MNLTHFTAYSIHGLITPFYILEIVIMMGAAIVSIPSVTMVVTG
jgi:hypothetical protein